MIASIAQQGESDLSTHPQSTKAAVAGFFALAALAGQATCAGAQKAAATESATGISGLPTPRFVSLKSDRVNLRSGPGTDYPTTWVFRRAGQPVEVIKEFEAWRQVRDADGTTGWVLSAMLSGRRTALVLPWEIKPGQAAPEIALKDAGRDSGRPVAMVEAGVIANIRTCDKRWCAVVVGDYKGYVEQNKLWGVYPDEAIK
jgi:SH3-like domain-containing protein